MKRDTCWAMSAPHRIRHLREHLHAEHHYALCLRLFRLRVLVLHLVVRGSVKLAGLRSNFGCELTAVVGVPESDRQQAQEGAQDGKKDTLPS